MKGRKTNAEKSDRDTKAVEDAKQKTKLLEPNTEKNGREGKAEENCNKCRKDAKQKVKRTEGRKEPAGNET